MLTNHTLCVKQQQPTAQINYIQSICPKTMISFQTKEQCVLFFFTFQFTTSVTNIKNSVSDNCTHQMNRQWFLQMYSSNKKRGITRNPSYLEFRDLIFPIKWQSSHLKIVNHRLKSRESHLAILMIVLSKGLH